MKKMMLFMMMFVLLGSTAYAEVVCQYETRPVQERTIVGYDVDVRHDGQLFQIQMDRRPFRNVNLEIEEHDGTITRSVGRVVRVRQIYSYHTAYKNYRVCHRTYPRYTTDDTLAAITFGALIGGAFSHNWKRHHRMKRHRHHIKRYHHRRLKRNRTRIYSGKDFDWMKK